MSERLSYVGIVWRYGQEDGKHYTERGRIAIGKDIGRGSIEGLKSEKASQRQCVFALCEDILNKDNFIVTLSALGKNPIAVKTSPGGSRTILRAGEEIQVKVGYLIRFCNDSLDVSPEYKIVALLEDAEEDIEDIFANRFQVSATKLARYFDLDCERYLYLSCLKGEKKKRTDHSLFTKDMFEKGDDWENQICIELLKRQLLYSFKDEWAGSHVATFRLVRDHVLKYPVGQEVFLHGIVFKPALVRDTLFPWLFPENHEKTAFGLSKMIVDFLMITYDGSEFTITVLDAKASKYMKKYHVVQITYYALLLEHLLQLDIIKEVFSPATARISDTGGVWIPGSHFPASLHWETFSLALVRPILIKQLQEELPRVFSATSKLEDQEWRFNSKCISCDYKQQCRQQVADEKLISAIPYLSAPDYGLLTIVMSKLNINATYPQLYASTSSPTAELSFQGTQSDRYTHQRLLKSLLLSPSKPSPILEALEKDMPVAIARRCFLLPAMKDIEDPELFLQLILSLVFSPRDILIAWVISDGTALFLNSTDCADTPENSLRDVLHEIIVQSVGKYIQVFVFEDRERCLFINLALEHALSTNIVAGASKWQAILRSLVVDAEILQDDTPPELLAGVADGSRVKDQDLGEYLERLNVSYHESATVSELRHLLKQELDCRRTTLLSCPRFVVLHQVVQETVAIPSVGYFDLHDILQAFHYTGESHSLESIYEQKQTRKTLRNMLFDRCSSLLWLLRQIREISEAYLSGTLAYFAIPQPISLDPIIAKCQFIKQFEVLTAMQSLRQERITRTGRSIELELLDSVDAEKGLFEFSIVSGVEHLEWVSSLMSDANVVADDDGDDIAHSKQKNARKQGTLSDWLLFRRHSNDQPVEETADVLFVDALYYDALPKYFPWDGGVASQAGNIYFALLKDVTVTKKEVKATIQVHGNWKFPLKGKFWSMRKRYVAFNLSKTTSHLGRMSRAPKGRGHFQQLLENPVNFGKSVKVYPKLSSTADTCAEFAKFQDIGLRLDGSQKSAFDHICETKLTIIFGPPGTGKTHSLALSLLHMFVVLAKSGCSKFHVLMTAFTSTAIRTFAAKFEKLRRIAVETGLFPMLKKDKLEVYALGKANAALPKRVQNTPFVILHGTVWSVYKRLYRESGDTVVDMLIIDEASQLQVADASIAIDAVAPNGRIIICGDPLQLSPILHADYPSPDITEPLLASGILQSILRNEANTRLCVPIDDVSSAMHVVSLREQRRMTQGLSDFTESIYRFAFNCTPKKRLLFPSSNVGLDAKMGNVLREVQKSALATVVFKTTDKFHQIAHNTELRYEASVVAKVCKVLSMSYYKDGSKPKMFIVTPHRAQRGAVTHALLSEGISQQSVQVSTVDSIQGQEADVVLICYGFLNRHRLESELDFLFDLHRINVAISRARALCVLVSSEAVLNPPLSIVTTCQRQAAFAHLRKFYEQSSQIEWQVRVTDELELEDVP